MPVEPTSPAVAPRAVFLSYAREDGDAARRIADALRGFGVEVWLDQSELRGGDAWDQKIRRQIKDCALFVPLVSAHTQSRGEGYFRLEWKLAAERTHLMAEGVPFLAPVVIDDTPDAHAAVPPEFLRVQWTRLPGAEPTPEFVAQVKRLLAAPRSAAPAGSGMASRSAVHGSGAEAAPLPRRVGRRVPAAAWVATVLALAALLTVGGFFWLRKAELTPAPLANAGAGTRPPTSDKSVAVLAFVNMSADKDTEYFSDGVSEEILNALANNPALRVAGRTSSFSFKGKNATNEEIGRALHVASVIEGSVRRSGNTVRITVQLINAADGYHVWSEIFDREMTDIFAVQSEIATKVAQKLAGVAAPAATPSAPATAAPTKNLAAHDAYLRGRAAQMKGASPALTDEATQHYEEAVRLDPGYALAWARLAQLYVDIQTSRDPTNESANKARTAAATALRLEPNLPEAHLALATIHQGMDYDFDSAQRELDQVERLRPNDAEVPAARALLEFARGHWGEGLAALALLAAERDPQNAESLVSMGTRLAIIGKFAEADRLFDRAWVGQTFPAPLRYKALAMVAWTGDATAALSLLETCPERLRNEFFHHTLAELTALRGDAAATIAVNDRFRIAARRGQPTYTRRYMEVAATYRMGWHHARSGNLARAEELYAGALALAEKLAGEFPQRDVPRFHVAVIQARRGQKTAALAATEEAMRLATHTHDAVELANARQTQAEVLAALGQIDDAIAELRAVHAMGYAFGYRLRLELEWEPLRGDAKFQQLMKEAEARADAQPRPKK